MKTRSTTPIMIMIFILLFVWLQQSYAQTEHPAVKSGNEVASNSPDTKKILPPLDLSETEHILQIGDSKLKYSATAGVLPIKNESGDYECRIFFINYNLKNKKDDIRPITFVFNGGPGASSAYLHLAALGPKGILLNEKEGFPAPPGNLVDNNYTWLTFTDLVFIDPVGTGYSRCDSTKQKTEGDNSEARVWGVREDLESLAKFIRLFLTRTDRWLSPKFIVGESYGGFRVAALSDLLQSDYGIGLNGVVLISPALEFSLLRGDEYSLLPWIVDIPSYAATARFHGKAPGSISDEKNPRTDLKEIENFAVKDLLPALAMGDTGAISAKLGSYIGLSAETVSRLDSRIPASMFSKKLLQESGRLISVYDGSFTSIDPDPGNPYSSGEDPLLIQINTLLTAGINSYLREQLKYKTDLPYEILNKEVSRKWNWRSGLQWGQGYVGVAENLKHSMSINKDLKAFIAHGVFDLVTPYFGSLVVTRQMSLDPTIAPHLILKVYEGGHMFYTNVTSRRMFFNDARDFFNHAVEK